MNKRKREDIDMSSQAEVKPGNHYKTVKTFETDLNSSKVISKDGSAMTHRQLKEIVLKSMTLEEIE